MSFSLGRKASQNGLTMIEMLLVMSDVILIIGVAVGMRASVGRNEAALRFVTEYQFLQTKMRAAFSPDGAMDSGGFELLTNALAIQRPFLRDPPCV